MQMQLFFIALELFYLAHFHDASFARKQYRNNGLEMREASCHLHIDSEIVFQW